MIAQAFYTRRISCSTDINSDARLSPGEFCKYRNNEKFGKAGTMAGEAGEQWRHLQQAWRSDEHFPQFSV